MLLFPGLQFAQQGFQESILESDYLNEKAVLKRSAYLSPYNIGPLVQLITIKKDHLTSRNMEDFIGSTILPMLWM